jgi:hypothetical protein
MQGRRTRGSNFPARGQYLPYPANIAGLPPKPGALRGKRVNDWKPASAKFTFGRQILPAPPVWRENSAADRLMNLVPIHRVSVYFLLTRKV